MNDNPGIAQGMSSNQMSQSQAGNYPQGRRVTIGGMNRRSSLGMDDFFGRRTSGFGELDILGRRDSLDSTTAVLDAAIMDLTRRRLSMAVGTMPPNEMDPMASMGGMNAMNGGMNAMNSAHMGAMNPMMGNAGLQGAAPNAARMPPTQNSVNAISARQKQLQEQQRELERRQKELEMQRQQLMTGMEERKRVMRQMQQQMQMNGPSPPFNAPFPNSNLNPNSSAMPPMGRPGQGQGLPSSTADAAQGPPRQQWWVCQICNSRAFSSREEASQHEVICVRATGTDVARRRSSLEFGLDHRNMQERRFSQSNDGRRLSHPHSMATMHNQELLREAGDLGMDHRFSLAHNVATESTQAPRNFSSGPFAFMKEPLPLAMDSDKDWLTPLHCFVRRHCVQVFTASQDDVATPSKGKRKPIQVGQVGIRCPHCHHDEVAKLRERGSVYYPTTIASIYNATMNLLQRHLHSCTSVPDDVMRRYETLKADDARSGTSKKYWMESALSLGLVDTANGIRFSALRPPALPSLSSQQQSTGTVGTTGRTDNEFFSSNSNAIIDLATRQDGSVPAASNPNSTLATTSGEAAERASADAAAHPKQGDANTADISEMEQNLNHSAPLVAPQDEPYSTAFSFHLLSQMQPCVFTEADRLGKRKGLPPGFPGLACRHCFGGYGSGRFFPSSIKTLSDTSKTLNVLHNHMTRCRKCPPEIRETLEKLRQTHDQERAKMKFGSQKAFFGRIWERLHKGNKNSAAVLAKADAKKKRRKSTGPSAATMAQFAPPQTGMMGPQTGMMGPQTGMMGPQTGMMGPHTGMMGGPGFSGGYMDSMAMHHPNAFSDAKRRRMS
jgi:hypothetical protein